MNLTIWLGPVNFTIPSNQVGSCDNEKIVKGYYENGRAGWLCPDCFEKLIDNKKSNFKYKDASYNISTGFCCTNCNLNCVTGKREMRTDEIFSNFVSYAENYLREMIGPQRKTIEKNIKYSRRFTNLLIGTFFGGYNRDYNYNSSTNLIHPDMYSGKNWSKNIYDIIYRKVYHEIKENVERCGFKLHYITVKTIFENPLSEKISYKKRLAILGAIFQIYRYEKNRGDIRDIKLSIEFKYDYYCHSKKIKG